MARQGVIGVKVRFCASANARALANNAMFAAICNKLTTWGGAGHGSSINHNDRGVKAKSSVDRETSGLVIWLNNKDGRKWDSGHRAVPRTYPSMSVTACDSCLSCLRRSRPDTYQGEAICSIESGVSGAVRHSIRQWGECGAEER